MMSQKARVLKKGKRELLVFLSGQKHDNARNIGLLRVSIIFYDIQSLK